MKKQVLFLGVLTLFFVFTSCKKEETKPDDTGTTPTPTPTGFTPPTSNYWKIDTTLTPGSADAFNIDLSATSAGLSKPFTSPIDGYCQVNFTFNTWNSQTSSAVDIRSQISEGDYKEFNISTKRSLGGTPEGDSIAVNLTVQDNSSPNSGYYYYVAQGGKVYISKLNGKLRYTTKGAINLIGVKNPDMSNFAYNTTIDFSWAEQ